MNPGTVAEFESREDAERATRILKQAEITSSIHESTSRFELRVDDEYLHAARQYLLIAEEQLGASAQATAAVACPECGSFETRSVPPYAAVMFLVTLGAGIGLFALGYIAVALPVFIAGWITALWFSRLAGKRRCSRCNRVFAP